MYNEQYIEIWTQAKRFESLFVVRLIFDRQGVLIFERNCRISEVDAVISQIRGCFVWIPFDLHILNVCTNGVHVKGMIEAWAK